MVQATEETRPLEQDQSTSNATIAIIGGGVAGLVQLEFSKLRVSLSICMKQVTACLESGPKDTQTLPFKCQVNCMSFLTRNYQLLRITRTVLQLKSTVRTMQLKIDFMIVSIWIQKLYRLTKRVKINGCSLWSQEALIFVKPLTLLSLLPESTLQISSSFQIWKEFSISEARHITLKIRRRLKLVKVKKLLL